jgi:hypothetical protein
VRQCRLRTPYPPDKCQAAYTKDGYIVGIYCHKGNQKAAVMGLGATLGDASQDAINVALDNGYSQKDCSPATFESTK